MEWRAVYSIATPQELAQLDMRAQVGGGRMGVFVRACMSVCVCVCMCVCVYRHMCGINGHHLW